MQSDWFSNHNNCCLIKSNKTGNVSRNWLGRVTFEYIKEEHRRKAAITNLGTHTGLLFFCAFLLLPLLLSYSDAPISSPGSLAEKFYPNQIGGRVLNILILAQSQGYSMNGSIHKQIFDTFFAFPSIMRRLLSEQPEGRRMRPYRCLLMERLFIWFSAGRRSICVRSKVPPFIASAV